MNSDTHLEGFAYPVGYLPPPTRISDSEILSTFLPFEHPYVISGHDGKPTVDPHAPVAVRRLRNGQCPNLLSAIRFLEVGGAPDDSLEETYKCEDTVTRACDLSEAGFHAAAIELIRRLPEPFQRTAAALGALVESLQAQSTHNEALREVRLLIEAQDVPTEYARTLHRIREVEILLLLGQLDAAEIIMDQRREEFRGMYQYYGVRAAAALLKQDEALARALIVKAGRVDPYHCFKILWNPLLKPLESFIKAELLTDEGKPRVYAQNSEMHRICNRVQGAVLMRERERARNIAEGFVLHRITEWTAAEEAILALAGLGAFDAIVNTVPVLPGARMESLLLARRIAQTITAGDDIASSEIGFDAADLRCGEQTADLLAQATVALARGEVFALPSTFETPLVEVADKWNEDGRDLYVVHGAGGHFRLSKLREPRNRRSEEWATTDLRTVFPMIESTVFDSVTDVASWIEAKLCANASLPADSFVRKVFTIHFDGWALLSMLKPPGEATPLLREAWELASNDPNFYFHNGPAVSFGMRSSYALRLLRMLSMTSKSRD